MIGEVHRVDWTIPYPDDLKEKCLSTVLRPLTHFEHKWEAFPWDLAGQMVGLLEQPEAIFEYFHLTMFFLARAAMLALSNDILDQKELFSALRRHRVQAGGIYRKHLLQYLRMFLAKHNFARLPECEIRKFEAFHATDTALRHREHVQKVLDFAERDYVGTLNYISMAGNMEEEVCGHSVGFWVKGAEMPAAVRVRVCTRRHDTGYHVIPTRDEAKAMIRAGRTPGKLSVKTQEEFGFAGEEEKRLQTTDCGLQTADRGRETTDNGGRGTTDHGLQTTDLGRGNTGHRGENTDEGQRATAKVIGDYRVIHIPGAGRINLAKKHKARAVLGFIHRMLKKGGQREFYVEEMRDLFNAQYTGAMAGKQWLSDRFREDLFKGKEQEFDLLFEELDRAAGYYRMKILGWMGFYFGLGVAGDWGLASVADGLWWMV